MGALAAKGPDHIDTRIISHGGKSRPTHSAVDSGNDHLHSSHK
ncbi:MAG: hypothetical protein BWY75_02565 [bacterium ADurb.Bin425]|nr:MAG: hypothetical protein BWY75_02565 [bacterium ADurb.Bin425]